MHCPDDIRIRPGEYDKSDVEWWTKKGYDLGHIRDVHILAESLGWFIWQASLPDEDGGGNEFCDTYYRIKNEVGADIEAVTGLDAGVFNEVGIKSLLEFWEPHLRKMKEEQV